ncbi:MAG: hypothetical protein RL563_2149 [Pseudomonadota bacterium]|jgi:hypothetical protein
MSEATSETVKYAVDALSILTVVGTLINMLPSIAAAFTIVWTAIRIWETDTVRGWCGREGGPDAK